jgi:hypothetical protein
MTCICYLRWLITLQEFWNPLLPAAVEGSKATENSRWKIFFTPSLSSPWKGLQSWRRVSARTWRVFEVERDEKRGSAQVCRSMQLVDSLRPRDWLVLKLLKRGWWCYTLSATWTTVLYRFASGPFSLIRPFYTPPLIAALQFSFGWSWKHANFSAVVTSFVWAL